MQIRWNGSVLSYGKSGTGPERLLLFHGFGQDQTAFNLLISRLGDQYTCYTFDLFFHGESTWPDRQKPVTIPAWEAILTTFLKQENIRRFSLLGFSIGARPALASLVSCAPYVDNVILIAPDGIGNSFWFSLATGTKAGQWLFRMLMKNRQLFASLGSAIRSLGLIDRRRITFATRQVTVPQHAERVFNTWMAYRKMVFNSRELTGLLDKAGTPLLLITSSNDHVIKPNRFTSLIRNPPKQLETHVLKASHHSMLREPTLADLIKGQSGNQH